ncbi:hypothetical protein [Burkholderia ubonensis]|uniref:hypothetical protein n=1 Tax=Burkholderia ubonensis TaxID=101571 RepID=UPI000AB33A50|nr:hypothetical protein [Burkholderia ubonensis]
MTNLLPIFVEQRSLVRVPYRFKITEEAEQKVAAFICIDSRPGNRDAEITLDGADDGQ